VPAAPDYAPSLAASGRRRPPQRATFKNSRLGFFGAPSGRTLAKRRSACRTAPGYRRCGYKTASGRPEWLNADPAGLAGGLNLYAYVGDNPVNGIDPLGLWQVTFGGGDGAGFYVTFGYNGGQFNLGGIVGLGSGAFLSVNPRDSGSQDQGDRWGVYGRGSLGGAGYVGVPASVYLPLDGSNSVSGQIALSFRGTPIGQQGSVNIIGAKFGPDNNPASVIPGAQFTIGQGGVVGIGDVHFFGKKDNCP